MSRGIRGLQVTAVLGSICTHIWLLNFLPLNCISFLVETKFSRCASSSFIPDCSAHMSQHALFAEFLNSGLKVSPSSPLEFTNWSGGNLGSQIRFEKKIMRSNDLYL